MNDFGLMRHELAHGLGGMLAMPGAEATITGGDDAWTTEHHWPSDPGEFPVVVAHAAGIVLVPEYASVDDKIFYAALPEALRERARAFCLEVVKPALDDLSEADIRNMARVVQINGAIRLRRLAVH